MEKTDQDVVLALGSNQSLWGDGPAQLLHLALRELDEKGLRLRKVSQFFQTPCFPAGAGPDYVNAAAVVETDLPPTAVLAALHEIELGLGRTRQKRWAARTVDIDLLAYGQRVLPDLETFLHWQQLPLDQQMVQAPDQLVLPHPRLQDRAFVLVPMAQVAPDWHHPVLHKTTRQMCGTLPKTDLDAVKPI